MQTTMANNMTTPRATPIATPTPMTTSIPAGRDQHDETALCFPLFYLILFHNIIFTQYVRQRPLKMFSKAAVGAQRSSTVASGHNSIDFLRTYRIRARVCYSDNVIYVLSGSHLLWKVTDGHSADALNPLSAVLWAGWTAKMEIAPAFEHLNFE